MAELVQKERFLYGQQKISAMLLEAEVIRQFLLDVFLGRKDINKDNAFNSLMEVSEELELIKKSAENIEEIKKTRKEFFGDNVIEICKASDIVFMGLHGENGEMVRFRLPLICLELNIQGVTI